MGGTHPGGFRMSDLELLLGAIDDTIGGWKLDEVPALHILELLRRNLVDRMHEAGPDASDYQEEDPF